MKRLIRWIKRLFRRPSYYIGWDVAHGESRLYWVKSRVRPDGTIEIVDCGEVQRKSTGKDLDD